MLNIKVFDRDFSMLLYVSIKGHILHHSHSMCSLMMFNYEIQVP